MPVIQGKVSEPTTYNEAIRTVVNNLYETTKRVHLIDLCKNYADFYDIDILTKTFNGHSFPMKYKYMSLIIEKAFNDYILTHYDSFKGMVKLQ